MQKILQCTPVIFYPPSNRSGDAHVTALKTGTVEAMFSKHRQKYLHGTGTATSTSVCAGPPRHPPSRPSQDKEEEKQKPYCLHRRHAAASRDAPVRSTASLRPGLPREPPSCPARAAGGEGRTRYLRVRAVAAAAAPAGRRARRPRRPPRWRTS